MLGKWQKIYSSIKMSDDKKNQTKDMLLKVMEAEFPRPEKQSLSIGKIGFKVPVFVEAGVVIALAFVLIFSFAFIQAKKSVPGQPLYVFKKAIEESKLFLTPAEKRPVLRAEILEERISEAKLLAEKQKNFDYLKEINKNFKKQLFALENDLKNLQQIPEDSESLNQRQDKTKDDSAIGSKLTSPLEENDLDFYLYISQDLDKIIDETKDLIANGNFEAALEKISEIGKIQSSEEKVQESEDEDTQEEQEENLEDNNLDLQNQEVNNKVNPVEDSFDFQKIENQQEKESESKKEETEEQEEPADFQGKMIKSL